jgi:hypothetical protein
VGVLEKVGGFFAGEVVGVGGGFGRERRVDEEQKRDGSGGGVGESHGIRVPGMGGKGKGNERGMLALHIGKWVRFAGIR